MWVAVNPIAEARRVLLRFAVRVVVVVVGLVVVVAVAAQLARCST